VRINSAGRINPHHFRHKRVVIDDEIGRDLAGSESLLPEIDVVHESIERLRALLNSRGEAAPFGSRDDARDDIEWDEPLGLVLVTVNRERNSRAAE
jgi:hypothetical protein